MEEKKDIFYCDLRGTFLEDIDDAIENNKEEIEKFIENLYKLIESDEVSKMVFSFVSSDNINVIIKVASYLKDLIDSEKIEIGALYGADTKYEDGKITTVEPSKLAQIQNDITEVDKGNINNIYFADDSISQHMINPFVNLHKEKLAVSPINFISIIPGCNEENASKRIPLLKQGSFVASEDNALKGVNKSIESWLQRKEISPIEK